MFKKTLLAITIATAASAAQAGTIYSTAADGTVALFSTSGVATTALGANAALLGGDDNCTAAATELGLTLTNTGNGEGGNDDAITVAPSTGIFTAGSVAMTGANACTVTFPSQVSSSTSKSPTEAPAGTVAISAVLRAGLGGYRQEDTITFNFSGATIDVAATGTPTLADGSGGASVLELLDITTTTVRFTVKSGSLDIAANEWLTLSGIKLSSTGLSASTTVSMDTFATNTSGTKYDVVAGTAVHGFVPQYSASVTTKLNGVIDVQANRKALLSGAAAGTDADAANQDLLVAKVEVKATANLITPSTTAFTFGGDFAWLSSAADFAGDKNGTTTDAEVLAYLNAGAFYTSSADAGQDTVASAKLNAAKNTLTVVTNAVGGTVDVTNNFKFVVPGNLTTSPVLNATTYDLDVVVSNAVASPNTTMMTAGTDVAAGAWTLNGSVVTIPYMPFDANTAVILRHTNTGEQTGDISVRYMLEGVSTNWENAGVVASSTRGVMDIRDSVINAIKTASGVVGGKVAIEITTNVPKDDVTVYAGFKVKDELDRGFVGTFGKHGSAE